MSANDNKTTSTEVVRNIIIGLTVSFVALSLGAAMGILSGRGAFVGMMSAGIIATITSLLGGTRVQCSGPTTPMSAIFAIVVAYAFENQLPDGIEADHFINLVLIMTGCIIFIMGLFRLGKFIRIIPYVVVSGFMNGIAVLIWIRQAQYLFGLNEKTQLAGKLELNISVTLMTLLMLYFLPPIFKKIFGKHCHFIPSIFFAIVAVSACASLGGWQVSYMTVGTSFTSFDGILTLMQEQIPQHWSQNIVITALPFALELALLCYLNTLLTSLAVDRISGEKSKRNKELFAQGFANCIMGLFGGIPSAQARIRSILILKENATLRLAGTAVGIFILIELLLFQNLMRYIPEAVFVGVLIKVGFDVFDSYPVKRYFEQMLNDEISLSENLFRQPYDRKVSVSTLEMLFIISTALITAIVDLNIAVISMTLLFYIINKLFNPQNPIQDSLFKKKSAKNE